MTHQIQPLKACRGAKDPSRKGGESVCALLRERGSVGRSTCGAWRGVEERAKEVSDGGSARPGHGASRTRFRPCRFVSVLNHPAGMLVSWLWDCSGMGRREAVVEVEVARAGWVAVRASRCCGSERGAESITHENQPRQACAEGPIWDARELVGALLKGGWVGGKE